LHFMGYSDSSEEEIKIMRNKENEALNMFHVKQ
jgi:ssRNA-specific RNase YbeY (16S rRNA maturation enzyme)